MGIESGRSPGMPDRNGETSALVGCSDEKALSHSSCRDGGTLRHHGGTPSVCEVLVGPLQFFLVERRDQRVSLR